jgi:hypothetical protein
MTYQKHSLRIWKEGHELSEKEVFELLNHFAIKEDDLVSILIVFPNRKKRLKKVRKERTLSEYKKIKDEQWRGKW